MIEAALLESIFKQYEKGYVPDNFPDKMLSIFQAFKRAYDSRNISEVNAMVSEDYQGDLYGANEKAELLVILNRTFQSVTSLVNLNLQIVVYQITEATAEKFRAIIDLQSNATIFSGYIPVPFTGRYGGRVDIELKPEGRHKMWKIYRMYEVKQ